MESQLSVHGGLEARVQRTPGPGVSWKMRNVPNVLPGLARHALAQALGMNHMLGSLHVRVLKGDGGAVNYGLVSTNLVTTAFCEFMVDNLVAETTVWGDFLYHDSGIGTTAAAITDTDIETLDGEDRATGNQGEDTSVIYQSVGTISYTTTKAITEHGLFSTAATATLMDRHVFSAINVDNADSIEFTFKLTCTAGG